MSYSQLSVLYSFYSIKSTAIGTPTLIRTEKTSPFERDDFTNLSMGAINNCVRTYEHITPQGLHFHLCLYEGVCCVMVQDVYDNTYFELQYFTDVNKALCFINNL